MSDAAQVAEGFFDAWTNKDFERARSLLNDDSRSKGRSTASAMPTATSRR